MNYPSDSRRRLLFVTLSNIGDLVMTTPLLEALHLAYPEHLIDVVADARSSELLEPCPYIGRILHKDKQAGVGGYLSLVASLRKYPYDVAIDLRSAFLLLLIRCGQRGIKRRGTSVGEHAVQHHFTALRPILGTEAAIPNARLWLDPEKETSARNKLGALVGSRLLAIAPGANWPGKVWPTAHYRALIDRVANAVDGYVIVGSSEDTKLGDTLKNTAPKPCINLAGNTSLLEAAGALAQCRAFVGNDSGLGHMAAALQLPTVTVFGPGNPARYRPWGEKARIVNAPDDDLEKLDARPVADEVIAQLQVDGAR